MLETLERGRKGYERQPINMRNAQPQLLQFTNQMTRRRSASNDSRDLAFVRGIYPARFGGVDYADLVSFEPN